MSENGLASLVRFEALSHEMANRGIKKRWLRAEVKAGRIPCLSMGNSRLFDIAAVEAELMKRAAGFSLFSKPPDDAARLAYQVNLMQIALKEIAEDSGCSRASFAHDVLRRADNWPPPPAQE